jgi:hypothetical protein
MWCPRIIANYWIRRDMKCLTVATNTLFELCKEITIVDNGPSGEDDKWGSLNLAGIVNICGLQSVMLC